MKITYKSLAKHLYYVEAFSTFCLFIFSNQAQAQKNYVIDNPVLSDVRDVGAIKFNGEYYLLGMGTEGGFYTSEDMVHWQGPVHVFSMDNAWTSGESARDHQIHAGDINYINGTFHLYWSVNYWGTDIPTVHIGHATADNILGPYVEPEKERWFDNRIDPELFIDDDRKLYFYTVKFTDGNTIWGNAMINPGKLSDDPKYLFASLPQTWETYDSRVAEGPWVIKYRNQYYMMYNANHTSVLWGNYALGVAVADDPLGFNHGNKYPFPVVESNQVYLEDHFVDILKYSGKHPGLFYYTYNKPSGNWMQLAFDENTWQQGKAGFGSDPVENSAVRKVNTPWKTEDIWVRKSFTFDQEKNNNWAGTPERALRLMLRMHHDGDTKVYLNGQVIYEQEGQNYTTWNFDAKAKSLLQDGENILAVYSKRGEKSAYLDVSLFDMQDQQGDDILFVSGQPSIVRGPNGFEWWLIYFTRKNGNPASQFIDRVHFFNKELYVDGPTSTNTPGYHPLPAKPTFGDNFSYTDPEKFENQWETGSGNWNLQNEEITQSSSREGQALIKSIPASHYLLEAGVKINDQKTAHAGVYAWWQDENNWLKVVLDQKEKKWAYIIKENEKIQSASYDLFPDFNFKVYHTLTIHKNASDFDISIDHLPAPGNSRVATNFDEQGMAGLCTQGGSASFDGVAYTVGWDEFDQNIRGWGTAFNGSDEKGAWMIREDGLWQTHASGTSQIFKGDLLEQYDFSLQVTADSLQREGKAGIYPVYVDADNYLRAMFDYQKQALVITGKKNGKEIIAEEVSLHRRHPYFADMSHTDFMHKHFTLKAPAYIDAIAFDKSPHFLPDTTIENMYRHVKISYQNEGQWYPLTAYQKDTAIHPAFEKITFDPIKTDALRLVNKRDESYVYKIFVQENLKSTYHLRVAKQRDAIIFVVDGKEALRTENHWPAAQVGLVTEDMKANFNGIMRYHLP